ncbi:Phage capsid and scaffold [plant metagenome]|uniref:Phage capsid and scaffold n=1 Tax=plant metagenome TaxID=1297885 RepID=A0A484VAZ0_9ZZZZ
MPAIIKAIAFDDAQIKFAADGKQGVFEGYASVFDVVDSDDDIVAPGAFKSALATGARPAMHFNHRKFEIPVGKWTHLEEDSRGLFARGELTPRHSTSEDLKAAMEHGTVTGLSVGMLIDKSGMDIRASGGRIFRTVKTLREISLCTNPANDQAHIDSFKSLDGVESIRDVEDWLRDAAGLSQAQSRGLIARVKSAIRRESEDDGIAALVQQISSFPSTIK